MPNVTLVPAGSVYAGQLVGTVQLGDEIEYRIGAMDVSVNANTSYSPATGMYEFEIVPGYMSDFEDGSPGWTHSFITPGFTDEWHLSTQRNHTVGGSYSWKCGSTGTGNYANLLDAGLVSTEYSIGNESRLSFWHYINAETSSSYPGYAYDGGLVEISIDGGAWTQIEPIGGYPYLVRIGTTPGPFPEDTPIFSGSSGDWEQVSFNLAGYSGSARFRFRFGSDGSVNMEGWYIDDVLVVNAGTGASPILVELTPINPPIIIPPTGGNFSYTVEITNVSGNLVNFDGWIEIMLPDSSIYGPLFLRNVNLQAGASINRTSVQVVPANAPAGTYQYILNGGIYPAQVWDSDSFHFVKQ
jgi:hypothetical protein